MNERDFIICSNEGVARGTYKMRLKGDTGDMTSPGQFVMITVPGLFLRRPLSVCDWDDGEMTLIYRAVGAGTEHMALMRPGETLSVLTGLGNGFDLTDPGARPLIVGGGLGVAPMLKLARSLARPTAVLGFQSEEDIFLSGELRDAGARVAVATVDGTYGVKGFVTDVLRVLGDRFDQVYACGPEPMLKAVHLLYPSAQMSFEARMGCGFGACMGCSRKTKDGYKRICKEGPVLSGEEIVW